MQCYRTCLILDNMGIVVVKSLAVNTGRDYPRQKGVGESAELAGLSSYPRETYTLRVSTYEAKREPEAYEHLKA